MKPEFWHQRWREGQIGFHQPDFHPALLRYWPGLQITPGARVLVPLCGRSLDMAWLARQGHAVIGVELSPVAIAGFFQQEGLVPAIAAAGRFRQHTAARYELLEGDFFDTRPDMIGPIDGWYDRAALVALPPDMRRAYLRHLAGLIAPGVRGLLITHDYPQEQMSGPPFAVHETEVRERLSHEFAVEHLETRDVLPDSEMMQKHGLTRFSESVYRLTRL